MPAVAEPAKPAVQTPVADNSTAEIEKNRENKKLKEFDWIAFWNGVRTALQIVFTAVTTIATVYLAKFTYQLVTVTKDLHTATKAATDASVKSADASTKSADAAEKSAQVAQHTLDAQRPFLRIEGPKITGFDQPAEATLAGSIWKVGVRFHIQNRGIGEGMIRHLTVNLRTKKPGQTPPFDGLHSILFGPPVVGANSFTQNLHAPIGEGLVMTDADRQDFFADKIRLNLIGTLIYMNMAESSEYPINFSWAYSMHPNAKDGIWYQWPDEMNQEIEKKKAK